MTALAHTFLLLYGLEFMVFGALHIFSTAPNMRLILDPYRLIRMKMHYVNASTLQQSSIFGGKSVICVCARALGYWGKGLCLFCLIPVVCMLIQIVYWSMLLCRGMFVIGSGSQHPRTLSPTASPTHTLPSIECVCVIID